MCLIAMAIGMSSHYPWVCISNRDEFNHRPTRPLQAWGDDHGIIAGQDLQSHGTWLGVNARGDFAALTNIRNAALNRGEDAPSRGGLVRAYLEGQAWPKAADVSRYSGFNLIAGNLKTLSFQYLGNQFLESASGMACKPTPLQANFGVYTLSNASLNTAWPKTEKLANDLRGLLQEIEAHSENKPEDTSPARALDRLILLLQDRSLAPDAALPHTGVPLEWERLLSAIQIVSPHYGTRSSTAMLLDSKQRLHIREVSYHPDGSPFEVKNLTLAL